MVTSMAVACPPPLFLGFARQVRTKYHCRRHRHSHALGASRHESGTGTLFLSCPSPSGRRVINYRSASHAEEIPAPVPASTEDESSFSVLTAITSLHNDIVVVDTPASRFLLLDSTHNIHSMLNKEQLLTESYWVWDCVMETAFVNADDFASLPAIVPEGPIAILGLGGGTAAHIMLKLWPNLHLEGWEIDEIVRKNWICVLSQYRNRCGFIFRWKNSATAKRVIPDAIKGFLQLSWKRTAEKDSENYLALTGPMPDLGGWSAAVPHQLSMNVKDWRICELAS
ncbi:hypothetical protein GW17_00013749 [Ensete ventricosum]|nr:hypothetical protein GW17_00013749 [Ensete ventricosum]